MVGMNSRLQADNFKRICEKLRAYLRYHFIEKWEFVYLEWNLECPAYSLPEMNRSLSIRVASKEDVPKIELDIYPILTPEVENDKRLLARIGEDGFKCFIAERGGRVVHYFLVCEKARESLLMRTPIDKTKILDQDAYLTSTFTSPDSRGLWIVPHTLLRIFEYLKKHSDASRVLVLVHKDTVGAEGFYRRLGFSVIDDACHGGPMITIMKELGKLWKK